MLPVILFLFGFAIIIYVGINIKKGQAPILFGYSFMIVVTDSMEPTYKVNDFVVVKAMDDYNQGDVVTFYYDINNDGKKEYVSHRISTIDDGTYIMVGDNPRYEGQMQTITKEDILGKVIGKSTFLGSLLAVLILKNRQITFAIISLLLVAFIVYQFINIIKITKKKE